MLKKAFWILVLQRFMRRNFQNCDKVRRENKQRNANSTYPKGGVSFSKDSFVVNQTLVFQIKFCGKSPALRVAANRQTV